MTDDGIEMDYSFRNTRCFHNRLTNILNGISVQPIYGGPVYIFRNLMLNVAGTLFKMHNSPSGALMLHNTSIKAGMPLALQSNAPVRNCVFRNNLFVGTISNYAFESISPMIGCDFDYDGFAGGPYSQFIKWNGTRYATREAAAEKGGIYPHGKRLATDRLFIDHLVPPDHSSLRVAPLDAAMLHVNSPARHAGAPLPGFYAGTDHRPDHRPDLGAFEHGLPAPHYGPRPVVR